MAKKIKLPWDLPKTITRDNLVYKFISCQLKPSLPMTYPRRDYIEIHYKNEEWGYNLFYSRWTAYYYWKKELGIEYQDFIKYEESIILDRRELR